MKVRLVYLCAPHPSDGMSCDVRFAAGRLPVGFSGDSECLFDSSSVVVATDKELNLNSAVCCNSR